MEHHLPGVVSVDSELVAHMTAALPVRTNDRFSAVLDERLNPLILAIGEDSRFYAIKVHGDGHRHLTDIGSRLGVTTSVRKFAVSQSPQGGLFIAFSAQKPADPRAEDLYILSQFDSSTLEDDTVDLKLLLLRPDSSGNGIPGDICVEKIHLGPAINESYPQLIVGHHRPNGESDIARITVDLSRSVWSWKYDLTLPENAAEILDMVPGYTLGQQGLFYFYRIHKYRTVLFMGSDMEADKGYVWKVPLEDFPQDAKSIAVFNDNTGNSHLLVGSRGLWHYTPNAIVNQEPPTLISQEQMYNDALENLLVVLADRTISVWFEDRENTLGYQLGTLDQDGNCALHDRPVPLRPAGACAEFAPLLDPKSSTQMLVVTTLKGEMALLEQAPLSRIWKETPFHVPSPRHNQEYPAYLNHIVVTDAQGHPLPSTKLKLASSDWVTAIVNGRTVQIGTSGTDVLTDINGTVTLVVPADDISTFTFIVTTPDSGIIPADKPLVIDPSLKAKAKLQALGDGNSLANAKLPDGSPLVDATLVSSDDIKSAAKAIKELNRILEGSSSDSCIVAERAVKPNENTWDFFSWIEHTASNLYEWVVSKVKENWHLVVRLGEQVWEFLLDTAPRVAKAISFIFKKLNVPFEKLWKWAGYVFNWDDIKKTQASIINIVNGVMKRGVAWLEEEEHKVEETFARLRGLAESYVLGSDVTSQAISSRRINEPSSIGAIANTSLYHYEHSGIKEALQTRNPDRSDYSIDDIWNKTIIPALFEIGDVLAAAGKDILAFFTEPSQSLSIEQILRSAGAKLIAPMLDIAKQITLAILKLAKSLVSIMNDTLNFDVGQIPIFGWILGDHRVSLLDAVSLLLAIPATIHSREIVGRTPTLVQESDLTDLSHGFSDNVSRAVGELASTVQISWYFFQSAKDMYRIGTAEISPKIPGDFSLVKDIIFNILTYPPRSKEPAGAYEFRRAAWLVLVLRSLAKAIICKAPYFPLQAKTIALVDALTGALAFWLHQVVHTQELTAEYAGKDSQSTYLHISKSAFDHIRSFAVVVGVLGVDPGTKAVAAVASTIAGANAKNIQCMIHARTYEKKMMN